MNTKNDDPGKLLKTVVSKLKTWGEFNLNNPQSNISLIELKIIQ